MTKYEVELLPAADADLDDIFAYILIDNPHEASGVLESIFTKLKQLEQFPYSGVKLVDDSLNHYDYRMIISEPYIIFYRVIDKTVFIYRILHGARDYLMILKNYK